MKPLSDGHAWYKYTITRLNNLFLDDREADITEKYFLLGLDHVKQYQGDLVADKLLYLWEVWRKYRNPNSSF